MDRGDEETMQKISKLDEILHEYTVRFALYVLQPLNLTKLDRLT